MQSFQWPYELLIGLRYTRTRQRNNFISFISAISMLGIALGVTALITVLSVMNGFQTELRTRILGVASHVQVMGIGGELANWEPVEKTAMQHSRVIATAPFIQGQGMLNMQGNVLGTIVRGIIPAQEETVADFRSYVKRGSYDALLPGEFGILIGVDMARTLRADVGDKISLIVPQGTVTPAGVAPRLKAFRVVGVFEVGMYEYDSGLALVHMQDAQALFRLQGRVSGVRLKLDDLFMAPVVSRELGRHLDADVYIIDWTRSHANFFRAVQIEKNMMFIILSLIVAVAAFNIVSTLVMAVQEKQADIAILRTLGASPASIMKIFLVQGSIIGTVGLGLGVAGGVSLALNVDVVVPFIERMLGTQFLSKDVYYISQLPSELQLPDVLWVTGLAFLLTLAAAIYPSWRASRINPAEALRYE